MSRLSFRHAGRILLWIGLWSHAACSGCRCGTDSEIVPAQARAQATRQGAPLRVEAEGREALRLAVSRAFVSSTGDAVGLRIIAVGAREQWLYGIDLGIGLGRLQQGDLPVNLQGAHCGTRYWVGDVLHEAGMMVTTGKVTVLKEQGGRRAMEIHVTCRKRVSNKLSGAPHAPELPDTFRIDGVVWSESREGR